MAHIIITIVMFFLIIAMWYTLSLVGTPTNVRFSLVRAIGYFLPCSGLILIVVTAMLGVSQYVLNMIWFIAGFSVYQICSHYISLAAKAANIFLAKIFNRVFLQVFNLILSYFLFFILGKIGLFTAFFQGHISYYIIVGMITSFIMGLCMIRWPDIGDDYGNEK